jgi:hypothetical protein
MKKIRNWERRGDVELIRFKSIMSQTGPGSERKMIPIFLNLFKVNGAYRIHDASSVYNLPLMQYVLRHDKAVGLV